MWHVHCFGAYYSILWVQKRFSGQVEVSPEANFDFVGDGYAKFTESDFEFAQTFNILWTNFAKTGNPNGNNVIPAMKIFWYGFNSC